MLPQTETQLVDIVGHRNSAPWVYSDTVKEHFFRPKNLVMGEVDFEYNGLGLVGSPACGDMMRLWINVDPADERIKLCRWSTFGCGSAIASTSMMSVMVTEQEGMPVEAALKLTPMMIVERLMGLPERKFHCSVLGDKALRMAINDYFRRTGQDARITQEAGRMIDPAAKVTDKDIEDAVLHGARTLDDLQQKTKVGIGNPAVLTEVEQLLRFYVEKYYG